MSKLSLCLCIIALSSCASSVGQVSVFDTETIEDSYIYEKMNNFIGRRKVHTTRVKHIPAKNPGGVEFSSDPEFVKAYELYKKHNKLEKPELTVDGKPVKDRFTMYKLMGAKKVDTSDSGWEDYIPPAQKKNAIESMVDNLDIANERDDLFGYTASSPELVYKQAKIAAESTKEFLGDLKDDIREVLIEQQKKIPVTLFNYSEKQDAEKKDDSQQNSSSSVSVTSQEKTAVNNTTTNVFYSRNQQVVEDGNAGSLFNRRATQASEDDQNMFSRSTPVVVMKKPTENHKQQVVKDSNEDGLFNRRATQTSENDLNMFSRSTPVVVMKKPTEEAANNSSIVTEETIERHLKSMVPPKKSTLVDLGDNEQEEHETEEITELHLKSMAPPKKSTLADLSDEQQGKVANISEECCDAEDEDQVKVVQNLPEDVRVHSIQINDLQKQMLAPEAKH